MKFRMSRLRRGFVAALLTMPLYLGTCAEMAIRISINSVFDAADPLLVEAADQAGTQAGETVGGSP